MRLREDLSPIERRETANRLWRLYDMVEAGRSRADIQNAIRFTALQIQPFCVLYEEGEQTNPMPVMEDA
jgi:hypothetical protein